MRVGGTQALVSYAKDKVEVTSATTEGNGVAAASIPVLIVRIVVLDCLDFESVLTMTGKGL